MQNNYKGNQEVIEESKNSSLDYLILAPLKCRGCILGEQETQYVTKEIDLINKVIFKQVVIRRF